MSPRTRDAAAARALEEHKARRNVLYVALVMALIAPIATLAGCESAPGDEPEQGAVIGGLAGAAAGAALGGEDHRVGGAIIGAILGAGGGYLIGSEIDKDNEEEAREAAERARANPATPDAARSASTADIDRNGFVTVDEVVAMEKSGLTDQEMIQRLEATGQVFALGTAERQQLADAGVSETVITRMPELNRDKLQGDDRLSQPSEG